MSKLAASTHWLSCYQGLGQSGYYYDMACNILKIVKPGRDGRLKIEVFGDRCRGGDKRQVKYIDTYRVRER